MMNKETEVIIYSFKCYKQLVSKGIFPIREEDNLKFPNFKVWIFPKTDEVMDILKSYIKTSKS